MRAMDRREFLIGSAALGGAALLSACGSSSSSGSGGSSTKRPPLSKEPGNLTILEWDGYQAGGTKAQTSGLWAGTPYTKKFGADGLTYSLIVNDSQALNKVRSGAQFDLIHPCGENLKDYVSGGLIQPFDTSLLPSFKNLNKTLVKAGQVDGQQYMIPWDWGYGSVLYRTDKVDAADATGWELFWNEKYKGHISMWDGNTTNFEIAALKLGFPKMDDMTSDQIDQAKQALIDQKPLNKFYWSSEFSQLQPALESGDIWIAYTWQDQYVYMRQKHLPFNYMNPSQGRLGWFCGFVMGKNTQNYYHCHDYVESFINHKACVNLTNLFAYGSADATTKPSEIKDQNLAKQLDIGDPAALAPSNNVHLQAWEPNEAAYQQAWEEVQAS